MQSRQSHILDTGRYVQAFLQENADLIGPCVRSCRRNLDDAVLRLTEMAATQDNGRITSRGATARQTSLRTALRVNHMKPIAEIARQELRDVPEFQALRMPVKQLGTTRLVAVATAMAEAAQLRTAVFTERGLPDDFIARLHATASALTASLDAQQHHAGRMTSSTAGILEQERRLRRLFRLLNALVVPELGSNQVLLMKWKATRAVTQKPTPVPFQPAIATAPEAPATTLTLVAAGSSGTNSPGHQEEHTATMTPAPTTTNSATVAEPTVAAPPHSISA